ncbi:MAG: hypothetical protein J6A75_13440 [Lachnospiraceae bacterium]|nr:hypothetical protein [Lachnospiraceae bacterium]
MVKKESYGCPVCKKIHTVEVNTRLPRAENRMKQALYMALLHYREENVDIVRNEETDMLDVIYHSDNNSFSIVRNVCKKEELTAEQIKAIAEMYGIGFCL